MPRASWSPEPDCAIAHALAVVGDWWTLLIIRDVARGYRRFDELTTALGISRRVLTERLAHLQRHQVLTRVAYQQSPARYEYRLTDRGRALLPMLVTLQDWGDRWLLGEGTLSATAPPGAPQSHRVHRLVGTTVPAGLTLPSTDGTERDLVDPAARATVVFSYPATISGPMPDGWDNIPGAAGCTLENRLFRDRYADFAAAGVAVHGLSTQRPDEQRGFAATEQIPFPLLSDEQLQASAALRLPTFRAADTLRIKRAVLVIGADRTVKAARYPVTDIPDAVDWALRHGREGQRTA